MALSLLWLSDDYDALCADGTSQASAAQQYVESFIGTILAMQGIGGELTQHIAWKQHRYFDFTGLACIFQQGLVSRAFVD